MPGQGPIKTKIPRRLWLFLFALLACGVASPAFAQIGNTVWAPQPGDFNVQSPYNLPVSERYTDSNGIYHCLVSNTDEPFSEGDTTKPRTEMRFTPDYTSGENLFQALMLVGTETDAYCIFQIHTGDAQSPTYGSTTFMIFWYSSDGGSVHDYDGTELANNLDGKWFQVDVDHNMVTHAITAWIDGRLVWSQQDNGAGDFYFKCGVYGQDNMSLWGENYIQQVHIWETSGTEGSSVLGYAGIDSAKSNLAIQVSSTSAVSGSPVYQSPFTNPAALWQFIPASTGSSPYFNVINASSGMAMDVVNSSTASEALIDQTTYSGTTSQQWMFKPVGSGDGLFYLINANSGLGLDDPGGSTADGKQYDQFGASGANQEYWLDIPPNISPANNRVININNSTSAIAFDTTTVEPNPNLFITGTANPVPVAPNPVLVVTATSSNPALLPASGIVVASASSPWSNTDVGSVASTGNGTPGDIFTIDASGADIYGTADAFQYIYQPMSGSNGQLVARVTSIEPINVWSKGGVMMRSSTNANAAYAFMLVSASNGVAFQYRSADGGSAAQSADIATVAAPCWVKLVESGSNFSGYYALDNNGTPGTWTACGGTVTVNLDSSPIEGLAGTAHDNNGPLSTSTYDNVSGPAVVGGNESVTVTPAANKSGQGTVSVTVTDGTTSSTSSFNVFVHGPPTMTSIANQNIDAGTSTGALAFTVGDDLIPLNELVITASCTNAVLFPSASLVLSGTGASRGVDVTPGSNQLGSAEVVLNVNDGLLSASGSFAVTVTATPVQSWRLQYFGTVQNSGSAADLADPANDGIPNIEKFAFDLNPTKSGVLPITTAIQGGNLTLTYTRADAALTTCTFTYPWSASPGGPWSTSGVTNRSYRIMGPFRLCRRLCR